MSEKDLATVAKTQPCGLWKLVIEEILFYLQDKRTPDPMPADFSDKEINESTSTRPRLSQE